MCSCYFLTGGINSVLGGPFVEDWRGEGSVWDAFRRSCPPDSPARRLFGTMRGSSQTAQALNILRVEDADSVVDPSGLGLNEDPEMALDFCRQPYGRYLNGHFFSDYRTVHALYPIFSPSKAPGYNDIVIPSHYYYGETKRSVVSKYFIVTYSPKASYRYTYGRDPVHHTVKETDNYEIDWEEKKNLIFWRGASTGGGSSPSGFMHKYQRHR